MTRATGRRVQPRVRSKSRRPTLLTWGGALLSAVAWLFLVAAAVDFAALGLVGDTLGWVFAVVSGLGAAACLVLLLVLVVRGLRAHGIISDYKPRRAQQRRG